MLSFVIKAGPFILTWLCAIFPLGQPCHSIVERRGDLLYLSAWNVLLVMQQMAAAMEPIYYYKYTLWLFNIAMENGPFIDGLPIKNEDFPWLC